MTKRAVSTTIAAAALTLAMTSAAAAEIVATPRQIERHWHYGTSEFEFRELDDGTWQGVAVGDFSWSPTARDLPGRCSSSAS